MIACSRTLGFFLTCYACLAVVIVTCLLVLPPSWLSVLLFAHSNSDSYSSLAAKSAGHRISWPPHPYISQHGILSGGSISTTTLLSRAFASALKPNQIIPFYYKSAYTQNAQARSQSGKEDENDITITTIVTSNRFLILAQLAEKYQGPISATVHISTQSSSENSTDHANTTLHKDLEILHMLYTTRPYFSAYVDVHLILSPPSHSREFNLWRNIARYFAHTTFVMMLDVDFVVCTDIRTRLLLALGEARKGTNKNGVVMLQRLREGRAALVVPAFEYTNFEAGKDIDNFPRDKRSLLKLVRSGKIGMFHRSWLPGHGNTDYDRYYTSRPGEIYPTKGYQHSYEPYIIFQKEGPPWCDERFVGYGGNKAACVFEMYLWGMTFHVLSDDFLIHRSHAYEEKVRAQERRINRVVYKEFREEACLRYLNYMLEARSLDMPRGQNVLTECKKLKTIAGEAVKIIEKGVKMNKG